MIVVLASCGCMVSMSQTMMLPIVPRLPRLLGTNPTSASWALTSTLLVGAVANPILGRLGDMYGRRRVLLGCLVTMTVGSAVCARSTQLVHLLVGRSLQGLSVGVVPLGLSLMRGQLSPQRVKSGFAAISASIGLGTGLAVVVAALLTQWFTWHAVFVLTGVLGLLAIAGVLAVVDESPNRAGRSFDVVGAVWLSAVLIALLLPISKGVAWGWTSPRTVGLLAGAVVGGWAWFRFERRVREPVIDRFILTGRSLVLVNVASLFLGICLFVNLYVALDELQFAKIEGGQGLSLMAAGLLLLPAAAGYLGAAPLASRRAGARGWRSALVLGSTIVAGGYVFRGVAPSGPVIVGLGALIVSFGVGIAYAAMPGVVVENVEPAHTASAISVNTLSRAIGAAIGSATMAAILAAFGVGSGKRDAMSDAARVASLVGLMTAVGGLSLSLALPATRPQELTRGAPSL